MDWRLILEFLVIVGALAMGARMGGVGLGLWGAVGLLVLVVGFDVAPANIPGEVLLIVLTVIMAASAMEVAGGIDYLVRVAERIIRKNPKQITIVAPLVTYGFTFAAGTGHIVYPLLPVIYEVAHENGIRPERPMAIATIASQQAITASPVSAATAAMIGLLAPHQIGLVQILIICVPSTLIAVFVASLIQLRVGKELKDDPEYQKRLASGEVEPPRAASAPLNPGAVAKLESARTAGVESNASLNPSATIKLESPLAADPQANASLKRGAMTSALIFLAGVVLVVLAGIFPELRTVPGAAKPVVLSMPFAIAIVMLAVAAVILTVTKAPVAEVPKCKTCQSGITAIIGILGLAWLGDTFINANREAIIGGLSSMASAAPWTFAFGLFFASVLLYSQAATTRALMPLGLSLGIWPHLLIGMFPAVNGYFLIPNYGTIIAAVNFDRSGTTRIGKYVINHSFLIPGLVSTILAVAVGLLIGSMIGK
jgi:anaerobic C4-dicarboxylate transporter DcuA